MIDLSTLMLFAGACLALTVTPGPDMLLIASRSISQGRTAGFASLFGIQAGTYCHALAAALGLSQLFILVPVAYDIVKILGALYLLYLAWKIVRSGKVCQASASANKYSAIVIFKQGLLTNLLNPKMALFVIALFPQFTNPSSGPLVWQMLLLATILNFTGLLVNGVVILTASSFNQLLTSGARATGWLNYFLASVFTGLAVKLLIDERR